MRLASSLFVLLVGAFAAPAGAACGDGTLDSPGEQCDDGNAVGGDCCSSACLFEADGSPCNVTDLCYAAADATCDEAGQCIAHVPCQENFGGFDGNRLSIADPLDAPGGHISWWRGRVSIEDEALLGDPSLDTRYSFCMYDFAQLAEPVDPVIVMNIPIEPGPQWRPSSEGIGWDFQGRRDTPGGVRAIKVGGRHGRLGSQARFRARGDDVPLPGPFDASRYLAPDEGVRVGIVNDLGLCLLSSASGYRPQVNSATRFRDRNPYRD